MDTQKSLLERLQEWRKQSRLHMTLLDPEKQSPEEAGRLAAEAARLGSHAIMVGGSTGFTQEQVDQTVQAIKRTAGLPVILFPSGSASVSLAADAIYFMTLLNSRSPRYLIGEQKEAALALKRSGLEPISMAYLVVAPGMRVGEVGEAELISEDQPQELAKYVAAADLFGLSCVYLEAGSGAGFPVSPVLIEAARAVTSRLLLVGGGIRTPQQAMDAVRAGADVVVTGTLVEQSNDLVRELGAIIQAVRGFSSPVLP